MLNLLPWRTQSLRKLAGFWLVFSLLICSFLLTAMIRYYVFSSHHSANKIDSNINPSTLAQRKQKLDQLTQELIFLQHAKTLSLQQQQMLGSLTIISRSLSTDILLTALQLQNKRWILRGKANSPQAINQYAATMTHQVMAIDIQQVTKQGDHYVFKISVQPRLDV